MTKTTRTNLVCAVCSMCATTLLSTCGSASKDSDDEATDKGDQGTGNEDTGDTGERDTETDTTCGADASFTNMDHCAAICGSNENEADCESEVLPEHYSDEVAHWCRWYRAVEAEIDEEGNCVFGEEKHVCAYVTWSDECASNVLWCEGEEQIGEEDGASYFVEDGKTFVIWDGYCAPQTAGRFTRCMWGGLPGSYELTHGVDECKCACSLRPDAGV